MQHKKVTNFISYMLLSIYWWYGRHQWLTVETLNPPEDWRKSCIFPINWLPCRKMLEPKTFKIKNLTACGWCHKKVDTDYLTNTRNVFKHNARMSHLEETPSTCRNPADSQWMCFPLCWKDSWNGSVHTRKICHILLSALEINIGHKNSLT